MILFEHRRTVQRQGPARFVSADELADCTGFRSVYGYDEALARHLAGLPSHAGIGDVPVHSDTLFIDFDSDAGVDETYQTLSTLKVTFEIWTTGRRGVHFHIPCVPIHGSTVPGSQRAWVEAHVTGDWDRTIYRPGALIRLPGTWHEKAAGNRKEMEIRKYGLNALEIPLLNAPPPRPIEANPDQASRLPAGEFWAAVMEPKTDAGRNARLFHLGAIAARGDVPYDEALEAVRDWARVMVDPPLTNEREIERTFRNGYRRGASA